MPETKKPQAAKGTKKAAAMTKPPKSRYSPEFLTEMRNRLLAERAKYLHSAEEYRAEADSLLDTLEPGDVQFDEEGGEGATLAVERERDIALSNQARDTVSQIDAAMQRIDNGNLRLLHHFGSSHSAGPPQSHSLGSSARRGKGGRSPSPVTPPAP